MSLLSRLDERLRLRAAWEDHVATRPLRTFTPAFVLSPAAEANAASAVDDIRRRSAYFAGVRIDGPELAALRSAIDAACDGRGAVPVETNPRTGIALIRDPLRLDPAVLRLACDPLLCGIAERYLRRPVVLADVDMRRIPAIDMSEIDRRAAAPGTTSSHWHRDIRGRQVKVMVYLTDVGEGDSNFAFVPGTHTGQHIRPRTVDVSRFTDEWVRACGVAPVECYGPAGTTMVFDTNVIHRLRRKPTARLRDSVTFYYTPGQERRPLSFDHNAIQSLPPAARRLLRRDAL